MSFLKLENISCNSKDSVIKNLNFCIEKFETLQIYGENAKCKKYILDLISGIQTPKIGKIFFDNKQLNTNFFRKRNFKISTIFSEFEQQILKKTVLDDMIFSLIVDNVSKNKAYDLAINFLKKFNLEFMNNKLINNLDYEHKKLSILCSMVIREPNLLVFDDVANGLSYDMKNKFIEILNPYKNTTNLVFSTKEENSFNIQSEKYLEITYKYLKFHDK